ncbi:MAG: flavin-containing monooxygenase [Hyphomicrobiaceae bacterium]
MDGQPAFEPTEPDSDLSDRCTLVDTWIESFTTALATRREADLARCFVGDCHWRDLLALTWDISTTCGQGAVARRLSGLSGAILPATVRRAPGRTHPRWVQRIGRRTLEAFLAFDTDVGPCEAVLRLVDGGHDRLDAWMLMTRLEDIRGHEQAIGRRRPTGEVYSSTFGGDNWADLRAKERAFADRDPAVVVVGAGQAGLAIAARLKALGIDTLVIDKHERIGDNWRKRYHNLTLHNEVFVNHLPYLPFPETFPTFIPKDMLANWFEFYAEALELNVWTGTALVAARQSPEGTWVLHLSRPDGSDRYVKPRHVVFATGVSSIPVTPKLPGLDEFGGTVLHSAHYTNGRAWAGKRAIVIGTGTSGHDCAHDLHMSGAHVTMVQRSTTYIVSLKQAQKVYAIYEEGPPLDDCDLLAMTTSYPLQVAAYQMSTADMRHHDQPLLDALERRGFRLDYGEPDDTGFQMKYLRRGGGYYFDVGCSPLVASGAIGLLNYADIETFAAGGARLKDGRLVPADLIVTATGYKNQQEQVRAFMGDAIADRLGPVWGYHDLAGGDGELRNMWRRTPVAGLWFTGGSLAQSRIYSKVLALQIKASEIGMIDATPPVRAALAASRANIAS